MEPNPTRNGSVLSRNFVQRLRESCVWRHGNTNKGSTTGASGTINQKWLESAFLEKQAGARKIVFMHSTRVPAQPEENPAALHASEREMTSNHSVTSAR